ncbi:hypothetical protein KG007_01920 [Alistipes sp. kh20]|uniref:NVEALA domain-containing protein n=1 Tax=Alistipes montrealensis TaxID=2834113 RepID=UPI001BCFFCA2|nr:NVEALA domain-containing protein [Alistipes montrealensis]MBS4764963.1 hypothetical protein [Alistipes montrealensis]
MKKKILLAGAVALMAAVAVTGYSAYSKTNVSDLLSANVEALAMFEGDGYSCTASLACSMASPAQNYISCTGSSSCRRNAAERWVECDGTKSYC